MKKYRATKFYEQEKAFSVLGVEGRMFAKIIDVNKNILVHQRWASESRPIKGYGTNGLINVEIRFDDNCGNYYQSFSITAKIVTTESRRLKDIAAGGCLHDDIAKIFPELTPLIKWHLSSTDGPMHYVANTMYHARECDTDGKKVGDAIRWDKFIRFGKFPIPFNMPAKFTNWLESLENFDLEVMAVQHPPSTGYQFGEKYTFLPFASDTWHECPFDSESEALNFLKALQTCKPKFVKIPTDWAKAVKPNIEVARSCAIWPNATLKQLQNKKALEKRLPKLQATMKKDLTSAGFDWLEPIQTKEVQ